LSGCIPLFGLAGTPDIGTSFGPSVGGTTTTTKITKVITIRDKETNALIDVLIKSSEETTPND